MGLIDLFWNLSQDEDLRQIAKSVEATHDGEAATLQRLQEENRELQIRVGVLIRLLIERGVFDAKDYAAMVDAAQAKLPGPAKR